jgi:hypothetical protein
MRRNAVDVLGARVTARVTFSPAATENGADVFAAYSFATVAIEYVPGVRLANANEPRLSVVTDRVAEPPLSVIVAPATGACVEAFVTVPTTPAAAVAADAAPNPRRPMLAVQTHVIARRKSRMGASNL